MKRILAFALVLAMAVSFIPASFAASSSVLSKENLSFNSKAAKLDWQIENQKAESYPEVKVSDTVSIPEEYRTVQNPYLNEETRDLNSIPNYGYPFIDVEDSLTSGYILEDDEAFIHNTDIFGVGVYAGWVNPVRSMDDYIYDEGDSMYFNLSIYDAYTINDGIVSFTPASIDRNISLIMFAGDADGETISSVREFNATNGIRIHVTCPTDNTAIAFLLVIEVDSNPGVGWLTIGEYDYDFKTMKTETSSAKVGDTLSVNLGGSGSTLFMDNYNYMLYGKAFPIELKKDDRIVLTPDGDGSTGCSILLLDENKDVIASSAIPKEALNQGYVYEDAAMLVWAPVTGTYYIVLSGYDILDEGSTIDLYVQSVDDAPYTIPEFETGSLDISSLGTSNKTGDFYSYEYDSAQGVGFLLVGIDGEDYLVPGEFTLTGTNESIIIVALEYVRIVLDNVTVGGVILYNSYGPVVLESKNIATIGDLGLEAIYNIADSGVYLTGEKIVIKSQIGIYLYEAPLHIYTKELVFDCESWNADYYTWSMFVEGTWFPSVTFGKNHKITGAKFSKIYYDEDFLYFVAYTFADEENLAIYASYNFAEMIVPNLTVITDGLGEGGPTLKGDANCDGKVNTGDASAILMSAIQAYTLTEEGLANADFNEDGKVNTGDASAILQSLI